VIILDQPFDFLESRLDCLNDEKLFGLPLEFTLPLENRFDTRDADTGRQMLSNQEFRNGARLGIRAAGHINDQQPVYLRIPLPNFDSMEATLDISWSAAPSRSSMLIRVYTRREV